jgi:D-glycero-D-manno-heptose 1,7-bisphosphate phosphatase
MKRPAVFFDRDNTLIANDGYLGDPGGVALVEGAAEIVARVRSLGYAVVVFSNQSGVARGMFTEEDVHRVNARLDEMLADLNPQAIIDRHEFCPFHPEGSVPEYAKESELRKPKPGMIHQAAERLALDLSKSWVIGDAPRDIEAGKAAGCRTIWFKDPKLPPSSSARELMLTVPDAVVSSLREAMDVIAREALVRQASAPEVSAADREETEPEGQTVGEAEPEPVADEPAAVSPPPPPPPPAFAASEPRRPMSSGPRAVSSAKPLMQMLAEKRAAKAAAAAAASDAEMQESTSASGPAPMASTARLEELLEQILQEVQRRPEPQDADFSLSKLMAGIVQILAIAVPLMAYFIYHTPAEIALQLGIFIEALTIALLIMGRQR